LVAVVGEVEAGYEVVKALVPVVGLELAVAGELKAAPRTVLMVEGLERLEVLMILVVPGLGMAEEAAWRTVKMTAFEKSEVAAASCQLGAEGLCETYLR
jgi:hypothetical protein